MIEADASVVKEDRYGTGRPQRVDGHRASCRPLRRLRLGAPELDRRPLARVSFRGDG